MKIDKYKDVLSKFDSDESIDKRIKDKLIYYDLRAENIYRKQQEPYSKSNVKPNIRPMLKLARASLPSVAFLIFMVIIIFSVKSRLSNDISPAGTSSETSTETSSGPSSETSSETSTETSAATGSDTNSNNGSTSEAIPKVTEAPPDEVTLQSYIIGEKTVVVSELPIDRPNGGVTSILEPPANTEVTAEITPAPEDNPALANEGDFFGAYFDVLNENNVKAAIPNLLVRLNGTVNTINPDDLTDIVLTLNGVPIDNGITLTNRMEQSYYGYDKVTNFYFRFNYENRDPGIYGLSGKYKGVPFTVYEKILEVAITDEPANLDDLEYVSWCFHPDKNDNPERITELVVGFNGVQNSFYQSDLTDLKIFLNGNEITFSFTDQIFRYLESNMNGSGDTSFNLILKEAFTESGTYVVTGNYRGKSFTSMEITIP